MRALLILAVAVSAGACEKAPPAEEKRVDPAPVPTTPESAPTDSTTGAKAATDTTATKAATKGEGPLRDSAFGPKYTVDEKGKVTPIKKP
jgi:hypothetical protein